MRTLVILLDGLAGVAVAKTKFLKTLVDQIDKTLSSTRVVTQSDSTQTHANVISILTGLSSKHHGIVNNEHHPTPAQTRLIHEHMLLKPGSTLLFPKTPSGEPEPWSVNLLRGCVPNAHVGFFGDSGSLFKEIRGADPKGDVFVYIGDIDHTGHTSGWFSPEYWSTVHHVDRQLWRLFNAKPSIVDQFDMVFVGSDHGGGCGTATSHNGCRDQRQMLAFALVVPGTKRGLARINKVRPDLPDTLHTHTLLKLITPQRSGSSAWRRQHKKMPKGYFDSNGVYRRRRNAIARQPPRELHVKELDAMVTPQGAFLHEKAIDIGGRPRVIVTRYRCSGASQESRVKAALAAAAHHDEVHDESDDSSDDEGGAGGLVAIRRKAVQVIYNNAMHNCLVHAMKKGQKAEEKMEHGVVHVCTAGEADELENTHYVIPIVLADGTDVVRELSEIYSGRLYSAHLCISMAAAGRVTLDAALAELLAKTGVDVTGALRLFAANGSNVEVARSCLVGNVIDNYSHLYTTGDFALIGKYTVPQESRVPEALREFLHLRGAKPEHDQEEEEE